MTGKSTHPQDSSFTELSAIILSIEWEITDQTMNSLISEINRLKKIHKDNKIVYSFLQLNGSLGNYIRSKKVNSHPDSINLLHSIYRGLEKVATTPEITKAEMKMILSAEVEKFKELTPSISYGNKTQRKACKEMIEKFGLDETIRMVDMVLLVQGKQYAPRATTPYAMWTKIGDFKVYFKENNNQITKFNV